MRTVEQPHEGAVGDGAGHVAKLGQAMEPKLTNAREIRFGQRRTSDDVGEQPEAAVGALRKRRDRDERRIRSDVGIELRADARERLVHADRRAVAAAFVQHVGGDGREPFLAVRIAR